MSDVQIIYIHTHTYMLWVITLCRDIFLISTIKFALSKTNEQNKTKKKRERERNQKVTVEKKLY